VRQIDQLRLVSCQNSHNSIKSTVGNISAKCLPVRSFCSGKMQLVRLAIALSTDTRKLLFVIAFRCCLHCNTFVLSRNLRVQWMRDAVRKMTYIYAWPCITAAAAAAGAAGAAVRCRRSPVCLEDITSPYKSQPARHVLRLLNLAATKISVSNNQRKTNQTFLTVRVGRLHYTESDMIRDWSGANVNAPKQLQIIIC